MFWSTFLLSPLQQSVYFVRGCMLGQAFRRNDMKLALGNMLGRQSVPVWIVAASFGPCVLLSVGIRTEHVLIYFLVLPALLLLQLKPRTIIAFKPVFAVLCLFTMAAVFMTLVTFLGGAPPRPVSEIVAHLENYVQPIAIMLVMAAFVGPLSCRDGQTVFQAACRCLLLFLLLNTVLAVVTCFVDTSFLTRHFIRPIGKEGFTVAAVAATMGRYTGIFGQPMETGLIYSLGLLVWGYLVRLRKTFRLIDWVMLLVLLVGGFLSLSKVFLLGGVPLFLIYWLPAERLRRLVNWRLVVVGLLLTAVAWLVLQKWIGWATFVNYFTGRADRNLIWILTAGRLGEQGTKLALLFAETWRRAPLCGFGFGANTVLGLPYDSAYAEFFAEGGAVGLGLYVLILASIGFATMKFYRLRAETRLLPFIFVLMVGAGLGAPVLTANRFSSILWVLLLLIFSTAVAALRERVGRPMANAVHRRFSGCES